MWHVSETSLFVCVHGSPPTQVQVTTSEYSTLDHLSDWVYNRGRHRFKTVERVIVTRVTPPGQMCVSRGMVSGQWMNIQPGYRLLRLSTDCPQRFVSLRTVPPTFSPV